MPFSGLQLIFR